MSGRPGQSRLASLAESLANVMIGFLLALAAQCVVFPLFGIDTTFRTDLAISALFAALSIIRSFLLRRLFEALIAR
jgi:predicted membrane protein